MERKRPTLDNPGQVAATLRYRQRTVTYERRPLQPTTFSDIVAARRPQTLRHAATVSTEPVARPSTPSASYTYPKEKIVDASAESPAVVERPQHWHLPSATTAMYAMSAIVFVCGMLVSVIGLHTNHQVAAQVKNVSQTADDATHGNNAPPSATKPSAAAVRNYHVAPTIPRYLDIPTLNVHTRILSEGVDRHNQLQVPWNIYDTGWYNASSQPGQNGAMLIDGHSGIGNTHGIFYKLASIKSGDRLIVTRGDGQKFTYVVQSVATVNAKKVDMASMLVSADTNKPGLNLITCTGDQIPGTTELNQRVLVQAVAQ